MTPLRKTIAIAALLLAASAVLAVPAYAYTDDLEHPCVNHEQVTGYNECPSTSTSPTTTAPTATTAPTSTNSYTSPPVSVVAAPIRPQPVSPALAGLPATGAAAGRLAAAGAVGLLCGIVLLWTAVKLEAWVDDRQVRHEIEGEIESDGDSWDRLGY